MSEPSDTPRVDDGACEVPFLEQLRGVSADLRSCVPIQWAEDGRETGHRFIPYGYMLHRAADEIESLRAALTAARQQQAEAQKDRDNLYEELKAARQQRWVSVKERLPERNRTVFVWEKGIMYEGPGDGYPGLIDEWRDEYAQNITHWMDASDPGISAALRDGDKEQR